LFLGPKAEKIINLCAHDNHYDVIRSMKAFFSRGYFCDACNVGYNDKSKHLCEKNGHAVIKHHHVKMMIHQHVKSVIDTFGTVFALKII